MSAFGTCDFVTVPLSQVALLHEGCRHNEAVGRLMPLSIRSMSVGQFAPRTILQPLALSMLSVAVGRSTIAKRRHRRVARILACQRMVRRHRLAMCVASPSVTPTSSANPETDPLDTSARNAGAHSTRRAEWRNVSDCFVRIPEVPPRAIVHFIGGAFVGASPRVFYETFLERLAEEASAIVVAVPFRLTFDYDEMASNVATRFESAVRHLEDVDEGCAEGLRISDLPVIGVGHSCGAVLHAVMSSRDEPLVQRQQHKRISSVVLMSFNNFDVNEAVPVTLPAAPKDSRFREFIQSGAEALLAEGGVEDAFRVAFSLFDTNTKNSSGGATAAGMARDVAPILAQLGPLLGGAAAGTARDFVQSPEDIAARLQAKFSAPRTLLIQFANDLTDETPRLLSLLDARVKNGDTVGQQVECIRLPGGHTSPLHNRGIPQGDAARVQRIAESIGRFVYSGELAGGVYTANTSMALPELKSRLLRLTAGANRGFSLLSPERRTAILSCVEEIEAQGPMGGPLRGPLEALPSTLFGKWRLIWATSPDVLLLAALPLVDCGEIRQDIPPQDFQPGKPLKVLNRVELAPKGLGLFSALPFAQGAAVVVTINASASVLDDGALLVRFEGGSVQSALAGLPALPLPTPPSGGSAGAGRGSKLLTTFLDDDFRFARSPLGDVFVLGRAA